MTYCSFLLLQFHVFGEVTHLFKHVIEMLPRILELAIPADRVFLILETKSAVTTVALKPGRV